MSTTWTALSVVQELCKRRGLPVPSSLTSSPDDLTIQLLGILNESATAVAGDMNWPEMRKRADFTHSGDTTEYLALNYSTVATVIGTPSWTIKNHINNTLWCKNTKIPIAGPMTDENWQAMIRLGVTPVQYAFSIRGSGLCVYPVPSDLTIQFSGEFEIAEPFLNVTAYKELVTADGDTLLPPARVVLAAMTWRWLKVKGLPFATEYDDYQKMIQDYSETTGRAGDVILDSSGTRRGIPGVLIPAMNWTP